MADSSWTLKGATFSDKSARNEFGLTQEEIIKAIKAGHLQYRNNHIHGNPYLRLLRSEVEAFVSQKYGRNHLQNKQVNAELKLIDKAIRSLKKELTQLEKRKAELLQQTKK
ncbi:MAG: hypothetical protein AABZ60_23210 [Planctomycetota bacterium]